MNTIVQDLRFSVRMFIKNPAFTLLAILTLALGIGANSTVFSWINSTLLNPIPGVAHTGDLVTIMRGERTEHPSPPFSYLDYVDLRDRTQSFSGILGYHDDFMSLTGTDRPERIYGALTTANYFDVLGTHPMLGRGFVPSEEQVRGGGAVAVISEGLWRAHFGADPSIIGKTIQVNRYLFTIIGVAPPDFQGCKTGLRTDIWVPLGMDSSVWGPSRPADRGAFWLNVLGRLKPGVGRKEAAGELNVQMQRIIESSRNIDRGPSEITLDPLWRSPFGANVYLYKTLPLLLALAAVLLLLACANVANLLLVRSVARRREVALRLSMGASRWRLMRQLTVETLLLALGAGVVALAFTSWTAGTFAAFVPHTSLPFTLNGHANSGVFLATMAISIVSATIFGIVPSLRTSQLAPVEVLKEEAGTISGGVHKSRLSSALVVAQISLLLLLLICAGLFIRSLHNAQRLDPGFDPNHVLLASYDLGGPVGYSQAQGIVFHKQLLGKLATLPGVGSVALADFSPLSFSIHSDDTYPEGYQQQAHESMEITRAIVSPNYFRTMRTPLVEGREFTEQDLNNSQPVAIVNQEFCDRYWPGKDAIGKRFSNGGVRFNVVGVVRNAKYRRLVYAPEPVVFLPLFQAYRGLVTIHVRVAGDPSSYPQMLERTVHELNPDLPVFDATTVASSMQLGSIFERVAGTFASAFGLLALVLAAVGLYGVIAYTTRQRAHEFAIRVAMGAQRGIVFRLVLGQGLLLIVTGLAVGVGASLALTRYLKSALFGVTGTDVLTYVSVAILLSVVSLAACYVPARRAMRIDPMAALRHE